MSRYVVILIVPLVVGGLIAVAVLLINGLRERRNLKDMELREARRLNSRDFAGPVCQVALRRQRPTHRLLVRVPSADADEVSRTVSDTGIGRAFKSSDRSGVAARNVEEIQTLRRSRSAGFPARSDPRP